MNTNRNRVVQRFKIPEHGGSRLSRLASIQYTAESEPVPIEINDLSVTGAGFIASEPPQLDSVVTLSIDCLGQTVQFRASIRWVRPSGNGQWQAGCKFDPPISKEFFTFEAQPERQSTDIEFSVRREIHPSERMPVTISNYSKGGICVCATEPVPPGEKLLFEGTTGNSPVRFVAKVMWGRPDLNCYLMGCQFIGPCDAEEFHSVVEHDVESTPESDPEVIEVVVAEDPTAPPGVWAACTLIYVWSALNTSEILAGI
jgi:hypothetical protein